MGGRRGHDALPGFSAGSHFFDYAMKPLRAVPLVRCAIYTRVSTDDQASGEYNSLDVQRDICLHAVALRRRESWVAARFFEDAGHSGKNLERPGLRELIDAARSGEIDVVVVYKLDRITRSLADFHALRKELERNGVRFVSATESFDADTPVGMLTVNMLLSFAQFERETTVERVRHKLGERAKRGMWNGGRSPLGYVHDSRTKKIGIREEEAVVVRRIFELSREWGNPAKVAAILNAEGLRTAERQGRKSMAGGKLYVGRRVAAIVANPFYKGMIRHRGEEYPGEHPALVSVELWRQANETLRGGMRSARNPGNRNP